MGKNRTMGSSDQIRQKILNFVKTKARNEVIRNLPKWLSEDKVFGDVTSHLLGLDSADRSGKIIFFSKTKEKFLLAGADFLQEIFNQSARLFRQNLRLHFNQYKKDGDVVKYKEKIFEVVSNNIGFLLSLERLCLNLIIRLSAIATETRRLVDIVSGFGVHILATRKTTPGLRFLEKYAVCVGGGLPYRLDLSSGVMIKDNHIGAVGGMKNLLSFFQKLENEKLKKILRKGITIEVQSKEDLSYALKIAKNFKDKGIDFSNNLLHHSCFIIMLDNFDYETSKSLLNQIRDFSSSEGIKIFVELSGGIRPHNVKLFAKIRPDAISTSYITFSPSFFPDISADIFLD